MRSPISVKIPKRSKSAFPNKRVFHFDLTSGWTHAFEAQFSFYRIDRAMRRRDEQGRGGKSGS
jgi:hypothetical protein